MIRMHVALDTPQLDASTAFYRVLFDTEPTMVEHDYTRFVLDTPGLVLTLNAGKGEGGGKLNHMGIRVEDTAAVETARARIVAAGLPVRVEEKVDCCYALQDKFWVNDPDGNPWEIYTVLRDDTRPEMPPAEKAACGDGGCVPASAAPAEEQAAEQAAEQATEQKAEEACCAPTCCA